MRKVFAIVFVLLASMSFAMAQSVEELRASAEKLKDIYSEPAALGKYNEILKKAPNDYNALWNASFLYSKIGNRLNSDDDKTTYFTKARELAEKAIKENPKDAEGYFVMSVALGRIALISGAKERVAASKAIKAYAQTALKYDGQHAGAWDVLGRWHYKVANLSFAERSAANLLFGGAPKGASNENAISSYQNAIKYDSDYILFYRDIVEVYVETGNCAKAKEYGNKGLGFKSVTPDDDGHKAKIRELLAECN